MSVLGKSVSEIDDYRRQFYYDATKGKSGYEYHLFCHLWVLLDKQFEDESQLWAT